MGLFSRQDTAPERTPQERAHARAVRDARRRGLPDPPPPWADEEPEPAETIDGVHAAPADGALVTPPDVEPIATRLRRHTAPEPAGDGVVEPPGDSAPPAAGEPANAPRDASSPEPALAPDPTPAPSDDAPSPSGHAAAPPPAPLDHGPTPRRAPEHRAAPTSDHARRPSPAHRPAAAPDPGAARAPRGAPEPAVARGRSAPLRWDVTDEWEAAEPAHGHPVEPGAPPSAPDPRHDPAPVPPDRPHGDPLVPDDDDEPAPAAGLPRAPGLSSDGDGARRGRLARLGRGRSDDAPARALGRELPPLPARAAARQPPEPPTRRRGGPPAPPSRGPEPRRRRRRWGLRFFALIALLAAAAAIAFLIAAFQPLHGKGHGSVRIAVPNGATAREIGDELAQRGVVADGRLFAVRAALSGKRGDFKAGGFTLRQDMSYGDAISALMTNPAAAPTIRVTIPEGRARREAAPLVKQAGITGDYVRATSGRPARDLGAPRGTTTLEGFLFPATYELPRRGATVQRLIAEQLKAFRENFAKVSLRSARRKNLTRYDVLTIASMVEREAQIASERRLVAAVIYNRLHEGIPLGIDATIRFATRNWSSPLKVSELNLDSPYNLRKHTGLPPTPIGSPGLASIEAAANPAHVPYLYYVLKPCAHGAHAFSSTDARFQRDVRRYNRERAKLGGRSPVDC